MIIMMHTAFFDLPNNSQVIRVRGAAAPILFSFRLPVVCNARYIYIICDPMRNHNNEFILIIYIARGKNGRF